ncbi:methionine ABC transporter ATP-binding protein [Bacillus xiapuensis]|uniref:methionine ABC transporter ATP-binding protein n=1 Tax=Bacillus xiapuensis TaxID=2014075 RepID=UPI000C247B0A|nr:methionine ABC transporter ATP-binding protein [Bacillus xiapuensis]
MIELQHVTKVFNGKKGSTYALNDVSLHVKKGEVFGVIGYSGAGKSTLIRTVNLLERPTSGTVKVNGADLTSLSSRQLREARQKVGMIFQGFNLLQTATVYDNVVIPLKLAGLKKKEAAERAKKYLAVVGLDKLHRSYPGELSGGQKQRVAIARALAHEPEILLCDEATSALDPDTTEAILDLLLKINRDLGITILLITHEMNVVQRICDRVAVMESGQIIEQGSVADLFTAPKHKTTRKFIGSVFSHDIPQSMLEHLHESGKIVLLSFFGHSSEEPALALVSKSFKVFPNILSGSIIQMKDQPYGQLLVHLQGEPEEIDKAIHFLIEKGVQVEGEDHYAVNVQRIS